MFLSPLFPPLCSPRRSLGPWFSLYRQRICRQDWPSSVDASKIGSQRKSCIPENLPVTAGSLRQNGLECVYIIFESRTTTYQQQKNISTSHTACPSVSFRSGPQHPQIQPTGPPHLGSSPASRVAARPPAIPSAPSPRPAGEASAGPPCLCLGERPADLQWSQMRCCAHGRGCCDVFPS